MELRSRPKPLQPEPEPKRQSGSTCLCGQSINVAPNKVRRHYGVVHCYCYDCKGVFVKSTHTRANPTHRVGTYEEFPPADKRRPPLDNNLASPHVSEDIGGKVSGRPVTRLQRLQQAQNTENHDHPSRPRLFTLWVLIGDTDDAGDVVHKYKPENVSFCDVSLYLEPASVQHEPWVPAASKWKQLQKRFPGFLKSSSGLVQVHQSLLTSVIATASDGNEVKGAIRTWEQVESHLQARDLHSHFDLDPHRDRLVLALMETGFPVKSTIQSQYDCIEDYLQVIGSAYNSHTIAYPSREERNAAEYKLQDIRALDEIAEARGMWRPTTCYGFGDCAMANEKDILKRSWSSSSLHATTDGGHASKLTCTRSKRRKVDKKAAINAEEDGEGVWFHQEYVEMLAERELRVFIATRPDPHGTRGLRGEVVRVCCTRPDPKEGGMHATEAIDNTYERLGTTKYAVHELALDVFEALRNPEYGWKSRFETLEVGCRLDISAKHVGGPLFVNEITRWNGSHYFSNYCTGDPHALICSTYATAWKRYVETLAG
ncbi:hypothetical protein CGCF415_v009634 [Colletotrichum fructicola]|uniref:Uncharacterized protein n=1 Tax=Colletotrichum fructicola (strain Nara gc5) TaxID=1213859 RepID=L2FL88_COLFN|nr:uncharacterized protein CGMCC3_g13848 [Colletotrichum fructicola]KAF4479918.1 hypothetical protein CGGC5_v011719 [Colletotrichum fructicola Nara gc5]KAE9569980.1 hypothetical protein CGMCC3_g13848 [Colletotrichum fructicola]KAF4891630.1 hypothetical protein CGCFRS4_v008053 [Colletotrichum fructicola]KAF4901693.1 hypothetical protein CGCF415_v009634 [Colletotrichum fructicola]KAF4935074.1 hypothetical protein CGCF245_v008014 [Colletotrichum fructicola]